MKVAKMAMAWERSLVHLNCEGRARGTDDSELDGETRGEKSERRPLRRWRLPSLGKA